VMVRAMVRSLSCADRGTRAGPRTAHERDGGGPEGNAHARARAHGRGRRCVGIYAARCSSRTTSTVAFTSDFGTDPEEDGEDADMNKQLGRPGLGAIGAEYGEGFGESVRAVSAYARLCVFCFVRFTDAIVIVVEFRMSGDVQVDVEKLNERLEIRGATRLRHSAIAPDEAYGLVFTWDGVVSDTVEMQRKAWLQLAEEENFKWPEIERPFLFECTPERAITEILYWTRDFAYARKLGWRLAEIYTELFEAIAEPKPGIKHWLTNVSQYGIPRAVVSNMSRQSVHNSLDKLGLSQMFDSLVVAEDDMDTCASQLLSASLKLGRRPKQCVTFTSSPQMVTAAHNCTMKAIGVIGMYKHYDLKHADMTCASLNELSIINLRRLFAAENQFMDLRKERV